ncbi:hypothetical protein D3C76_1566070 [compost metagenome]
MRNRSTTAPEMTPVIRYGNRLSSSKNNKNALLPKPIRKISPSNGLIFSSPANAVPMATTPI